MICPDCKVELKGILGTETLKPMAGDLTICFECAQPSIFYINEKGALDLRPPKDGRERFECEVAIGFLIAQCDVEDGVFILPYDDGEEEKEHISYN